MQKRKGFTIAEKKGREKTKDRIFQRRNVKKKGGPAKGKDKEKAEIETMDANRCTICDIKWEDDDGKNGEWLGCECCQWLHEDCIEYDLDNPYLICPDCNCVMLVARYVIIYIYIAMHLLKEIYIHLK